MAKERIYIFGAGHGAVELLEHEFSEIRCPVPYPMETIIFVEDNPSKEFLKIEYETFTHHYKIISNAEFDRIKPDSSWVFLFISAFDPKYKQRIWEKYHNQYNFRNFIDVSAIALGVKWYDAINVDMRPFSMIGSTATIGNCVKLNHYARVLIGASVGDYSFIGTGSQLLADAKVGKSTIVYSGVTINPGVYVGNNCIIGAGSVVTRDIPDNSMAYGVPCKVIGTIDPGYIEELANDAGIVQVDKL